jgi:porin
VLPQTHSRTSRRALSLLSAASAALLGACTPLAAEEPNANGITEPSIATSLPNNGDPEGRRKELAARGVIYDLYYTHDVLSNVDGGQRRGTIDQGKVEGALKIDLEKAVGLQGLSFFANGFVIHNTGRMKLNYVGGINTIAAIEAVPTIRLSELWLEQKLGDGKTTFRIGQLAADTEFFFATLSTIFLQSDWPTIAAQNLPSGGPAYPFSTPGVRLKYESPSWSFLAAVFNGDPAGPGEDDPELRNRYGLNFRVTDPPLAMAEAQWRRNTGKNDAGLATTLKLGAWGHFGTFDDPRFANDGKLLADPTSSKMPLKHRGDSGLYAVVEQQIYRPKGGDGGSGVSVYTRISGSPSDRNPIDAYFDGGIVFAGLLPDRPNDRFGAGFIYSRFSDSVRAFDRDQAVFGGRPINIRDFEANLELTYEAQVIPGWTIQPALTFIWHPDGDASKDATVVGVRSFIHY